MYAVGKVHSAFWHVFCSNLWVLTKLPINAYAKTRAIAHIASLGEVYSRWTIFRGPLVHLLVDRALRTVHNALGARLSVRRTRERTADNLLSKERSVRTLFMRRTQYASTEYRPLSWESAAPW